MQGGMAWRPLPGGSSPSIPKPVSWLTMSNTSNNAGKTALPDRLIRVGVLLDMGDPARALRLARTWIGHGVESFNLTWWQNTGNQDLARTARQLRELTDPAGVTISCVSVFGNPLAGNAQAADHIQAWESLIDQARLFGCSLVTGFTGRLTGRPVPESLPAFKAVFAPLAAKAASQGVRLAFENCPMDGNWQTGDWNIAHNPAAWQLMFDAVPADNVGLQWEPCHQLCQLIDPLPQLREWVPKVFHVHGKDATVARDLVARHGVGGCRTYAWHRTPGFGDTNWADVVTILMQAGYRGSLDIEGFHDPVHNQELELSAQVRALRHLKDCRGGDWLGPLPD